ncbi:MAG: SRPBCC domain-containing protein [Pseudomonas sp.]|uniref:SRPBCC family protein n=1 Tax=Pseudomonas sp. TaxID=306 RepID=UPI003395EA93
MTGLRRSTTDKQANTAATAESAKEGLVISRLIDAPRERVFQAWTDPAELVHWWGPHGFSTPLCELDVRPGGEFRLHMRSPEGEVYPIRGRYHEVVCPELLVYSDDWEEGFRPSQDSHVQVQFTEQADKTLLTVRSLFASVEEREAMEQQGLIEGWLEGLERLESHLAKGRS